MEKKIKLSILGFSFNQTQTSTYGLVLAEEDGLRRLMIIIGSPEAQSIAFKLHNTEPPRPLTHDLFQKLLLELNVVLQEVLIYKYQDGVFFSRLILKQKENIIQIESRTSDAIAIALRTKSSIYTYENIMQDLAIVVNENELNEDELELKPRVDNTEDLTDYSLLNTNELSIMLDDAIKDENYELASLLRDELGKKENNG